MVMITNLPRTSALIAAAIFALGPISSTFASEPNREQAKANFLQADANQDRHLNFTEFTKFLNLNADHNIGRAATIRRFGMHGRAFQKVDANRDGMVSPQELAATRQNQ